MSQLPWVSGDGEDGLSEVLWEGGERLNIRNPEIQKAAEVIRVGDAERYRRLVHSRAAPTFTIIQIFAS